MMAFFNPWIGKHYFNNKLFSKRIFILGESHYCDKNCIDCGNLYQHPECGCITSDVIGWYLNPEIEREKWMNTYLKFERLLVGKETSNYDSIKIWDSLVFYNFLQVAMSGPRISGTNQEYADAAKSFLDTLEQYCPDVLIVWGLRLWDNLPNRYWEDGGIIKVDGYSVSNGYYNLPNGHKVRAFAVYHPSTGYDWNYWYKVISRFI